MNQCGRKKEEEETNQRNKEKLMGMGHLDVPNMCNGIDYSWKDEMMNQLGMGDEGAGTIILSNKQMRMCQLRSKQSTSNQNIKSALQSTDSLG